MSQRPHPSREPDGIRRRPDGSIDLDHYRRAARAERAGVFRAMVGPVGAALAALFSGRPRGARAARRCPAG